MGNDEFEEHEAKARAQGEPGVEQPEGGRRHRFVEAADPADETVGGEEGQIVEADDRGVDRFGRDLGEERETYRQEMGDLAKKIDFGLRIADTGQVRSDNLQLNIPALLPESKI